MFKEEHSKVLQISLYLFRFFFFLSSPVTRNCGSRSGSALTRLTCQSSDSEIVKLAILSRISEFYFKSPLGEIKSRVLELGEKKFQYEKNGNIQIPKLKALSFTLYHNDFFIMFAREISQELERYKI